MVYYSQYGQDEFLDKVVFNGKKNGFFIDIGAHDGVTISNSLFLKNLKTGTVFVLSLILRYMLS